MVNLKCNTILRLLRSVILGVIIGALLCLSMSFAYASLKTNSPNVIVDVDNKGHMTSEGSMFDNSLWYPGKEECGIIMIKNDYKKFKVTDLDLQIKLLK